MYILAVETSCDETAVAVVRGEKTAAGFNVVVKSSLVASQADIHALTGGVVPEVAAREHVRILEPLIKKVLADADVKKEDITALAVTVGPGLVPALATGIQAIRTLAFAWDKPVIPVHHIEGHIYSALFQSTENPNDKIQSPKPTSYQLLATSYPALALIVSGGHTLLVRVAGDLQYEIIGQTVDDAAGEVFDKVARMLQLPYPGGPPISKLAQEGNVHAFPFPRPMMKSGDLDFSFSGLKTAVLYTLRDLTKEEQEARGADIAASFQEAVVESLVHKVAMALQQGTYNTLLLAGGVAANQRLREAMQQMSEGKEIELRIAPLALCGDNAVMIGQVAVLAWEARRRMEWLDIEPKARIPLDRISF